MWETQDQKQRFFWFFSTALFVLLMVAVGGITRLTHSGLSMVEWRPLMGFLPPFSQEEWTRIFDLYKQSPEYIHHNTWMTLADFKGIFWWEYAHRLLGRLVGVWFALPLFYFALRGSLRGRKIWVALGILALGASQGVMGWYMVKSGLVHEPAVSHYRLVAHLFLALLLICALLWAAFSELPVDTEPKNTSILPFFLFGMVFVTVLLGGLVSGLKAGFIYNTFPLMGGHFVPEDYLFYKPLYLNFLENPAAVQFNHRIVAFLTYTFLVIVGMVQLKQDPTHAQRRAIMMALHLVTLQIVLGIGMVVMVIPLVLASLHQVTGVLLLASMVYWMHCYKAKAAKI